MSQSWQPKRAIPRFNSMIGPRRSSPRRMEPADWLYVALSALLQATGLLMLGYEVGASWFGWPRNWPFGLLFVYGGVTFGLIGLHLLGLKWQLPYRPITQPMPVFVCLCLDILVAAVLLAGLLWWLFG